MKNTPKNHWFTLIELIVVTSILILVSGSWILYFNSFVNSYWIKSELSLINNIFDDLDKQVKNKEIFDYELYLSWNTIWFYSYQNKFDTDNNQVLESIDFLSGTWVLKIDPTATSDIWQFKIYSDYKFLFEKIIDWWDGFDYNFWEDQSYKIVWYLSGSQLNNINLSYYSETNLDKETWDFLELTAINTDENKSGTIINRLVVRNIWWKKEIDWDDTLYEEVYLFFERAWVEESLNVWK